MQFAIYNLLSFLVRSVDMRRPRLEIERGPYHIITRGNNRQIIFGSCDDYLKTLLLVAHTKAGFPSNFVRTALMPNHIHLLVKRRENRSRSTG